MSDLVFKPMERDGETLSIATLPNGAEVHNNTGDYSVYDTEGRYLGFVATEEEALFMATNGFPNQLSHAEGCDIDLWVLWNCIVDAGNATLESEDGTQYVSLGHDVVMGACEGEHGLEVELLGLDDLWELHSDETFDVLRLKVAAKPYRLE